MSDKLSYSNNASGASSDGWNPRDTYQDDDIARIKDPDGGLSSSPRTAIPSPFAQLDLIKNAFAQLANPNLAGAVMNERLVSNALDVAQLFFDFENHKDYLRIIRWNRDENLAQLKADPTHALYGQTLELFLCSDTVYNFNTLSDWFILMYDNQVLGGTSPSSLVMAAPAVRQIDAIHVEQGVSLFGAVRHLWERDEDFVYCMFLLMNAYPQLRANLRHVYAYMLANMDRIRSRRPDLYRRITEVIPNPQAHNPEQAGFIRERLEQAFDPFGSGADVNVLGARLYHKRALDIRYSASQSDFVIAPTVPQPDGTIMPLVLRSGFNGSVEHYRYIDKDWDSATEVLADGIPLDRRKLPDTGIQYPFLTTADLLTENLLRLSAPIDEEHYFNGNLASASGNSRFGYLLPIKPEFFRWFTAEDLRGRVGGKNMLDITELNDGSVEVTLRIPIRKRFIELSRRYIANTDSTWLFNERRGVGRVVSVIISMSVFPFVRTNRNDDYTVQLFSMTPDSTVSLKFFGKETLQVSDKMRSRAPYTTVYYDIDGTWDYAEATIEHPLGHFTGVIAPQWKPYNPSVRELVFAVDFGTTNTHVEWAERGNTSQPLQFDWSSAQVLVAPLLKQGGLNLADQVQRVEFLPNEINALYGFPLRSALASNTGNDGGTRLFHDVNIPFLYERKYFDGYDVTTNLKWMGDTTLAREFLREILLLIKAKILLENADLNRAQVVYFFPVSMGGSDRRKLQDAWENLYRTYLGSDMSHLQAYPESIAPAYYYQGAAVSGGSFVSIDIGGGTSDIVIYQPTSDRMRSEPVAISSFRFAGNAIFGDAFDECKADDNPLLQHYCSYFEQLIANDRTTNIGYLTSILQSIKRRQRSEDINAFLFSIENVEELRSLREIDRNLYSYNTLLRNDEQRKLVFLYFYSAIIYYIANTMKAREFEMPKQVYFSGTGSKILNIVGSLGQVTDLTQSIFERVFENTYTEQFTIKIETDCPKQITCRGGIKLENQRLEGSVSRHVYDPKSVTALKYCHSMIGIRQLTFSQVGTVEIRKEIADQVRLFNRFFLELLDKNTKDDFGVDNTVVKIFQSVVGRDLDNYLTAGINAYLAGRYESADVVEDVPFFYPIIGTIRYNLLGNLCNEVISKHNNQTESL